MISMKEIPMDVRSEGAWDVCPACGQLLTGEYNYCSNCGQRLKHKAEDEE